VKTKKYRLTELGKVMVSITEEIRERFLTRKKMLVRTSRLAMEEFDRNKIAESLVKEASVPLELAQKIARETEKRLSEFKTKYLTAPLIREIVNAILIEKGLGRIPPQTHTSRTSSSRRNPTNTCGKHPVLGSRSRP